jgi:hypothetical protein
MLCDTGQIDLDHGAFPQEQWAMVDSVAVGRGGQDGSGRVIVGAGSLLNQPTCLSTFVSQHLHFPLRIISHDSGFV